MPFVPNEEPQKKRMATEYFEEGSLQDLINLIGEFQSAYPDATEFTAEVESDYDSSYGNLVLTAYRMETPAEVQERIVQARESYNRSREYRRRQYETLRAEFEGTENHVEVRAD